jgi:hypothetical protein
MRVSATQIRGEESDLQEEHNISVLRVLHFFALMKI